MLKCKHISVLLMCGAASLVWACGDDDDNGTPAAGGHAGQATAGAGGARTGGAGGQVTAGTAGKATTGGTAPGGSGGKAGNATTGGTAPGGAGGQATAGTAGVAPGGNGGKAGNATTGGTAPGGAGGQATAGTAGVSPGGSGGKAAGGNGGVAAGGSAGAGGGGQTVPALCGTTCATISSLTTCPPVGGTCAGNCVDFPDNLAGLTDQSAVDAFPAAVQCLAGSTLSQWACPTISGDGGIFGAVVSITGMSTACRTAVCTWVCADSNNSIAVTVDTALINQCTAASLGGC
jgi:hypothetical protein